MRYRLLFFCAVTIALAAGACWYIYQNLYPKPASTLTTAQASSQPSVQTVNGETVIAVSQAVQQASHIEVASLARATKQPDTNAWATVVDPQPQLRPVILMRSMSAAMCCTRMIATSPRRACRTREQRCRLIRRSCNRPPLQSADWKRRCASSSAMRSSARRWHRILTCFNGCCQAARRCCV